MKKSFSMIIVIMSLCLFACSSGEKGGEAVISGVSWETMPLPDAVAKAETQNRLILIDFFSPT